MGSFPLLALLPLLLPRGRQLLLGILVTAAGDSKQAAVAAI